ncbi:MAG TPA: NrfD/PsrC family molybdoenzyme membrane anchor subunit [Methylomirabilota bacterium]|nr:NrfD/PsrC family molybdoenzyme membrane anchor subunit [Methylomirabilota bacterium]
MSAPSSTYFTAPPEWQWLIILYFFLGGIAGGAYMLAALIDLFGRPLDRPLARLGYLIAFPVTVVCGLLLIVDLRRPLRFWHMLLQSETLRPMFKAWSPMSVGSWALLLFGLFAFLAFLGALAESDPPRWPGLTPLRPPGIPGRVIAVLGGALGFFVAGYTGVLLSVTNRPLWADTNLLGLVFLISGASTAAALLALLGRRRAATGVIGLHSLERFDSLMLVLELLALIALIVSLGGVARVWLSAWGMLFALGVVLLGIVAPLILYWRSLRLGVPDVGGAAAAALVLIGGFLLRVVIILSSEGV